MMDLVMDLVMDLAMQGRALTKHTEVTPQIPNPPTSPQVRQTK